MSTDPSDLTTVADLAAWLGLSSPSEDTQAQLQRLVTAASNWIQQVINRTVRSLAYTETRDGHGGDRMILANGPVSSVSSVTVDGAAIPKATSTTAGYVATDSFVGLRGYRFTRGIQNVEIVYTAGFAAVPPELAQACIELAALRWKERDRIGHVSKSIAGETVTFMVKDMPDSVRTVLNEYRKVVPL